MASIPVGLAALTPAPRRLSDRGGRHRIGGIRVEEQAAGVERAAAALATGAAAWPDPGEPWLTVRFVAASDLPPEGFRLDVAAGGARAVIAAGDPAGARHAARTLLAAVAAVSGPDAAIVPTIAVRDWPQLALRGTVEGFYGPPWTHEERLSHLHFSAQHGLNVYAYAPKDDAFHRARWRQPYPDHPLARIAELAAVADRLDVRFVYALAPGLSMRYSDPTEQQLLHEKADQLRDAGVRHFALLFDDIPPSPAWASDVEAFGAGAAGLGAAHGAVAARFAEFLCRRGVSEPVLLCPAEYDGTAPSAYRERLAEFLPPDALIWWSGPSVVSATVTRDEIDRAAAAYGRRIVLWDNVPVNDFERAQVYLGPLRGRAADVAGSALVGLAANPMIEALPSRVTLACAAEYAWDPARYDPAAALERALRSVAGDDADALAPLARACGQWPPDAAADAALLELTSAAADGDEQALDDLSGRFRALEARRTAAGELARSLEPWLAAGAAMGAAGRRAVELLRADHRADHDAADALAPLTRAALEEAEQHPPDVLRRTISPFARAALARAAAPSDGPTDAGRPVALVLGDGVPTAGEAGVILLLRELGLAVRRRHTPDADAAAAGLVVIARSAPPGAAAAARDLPCPLLALAHFVPAGLAVRSGVLLREQRVRIVAPGHPLAAGRRGPVDVHRWPGMSRWGEPGPAATIVARAIEEPVPVIFGYDAGDELADGTRAPADRVALFLGRDLLAPWLATPDAVALMAAAIRSLTREPAASTP